MGKRTKRDLRGGRFAKNAKKPRPAESTDNNRDDKFTDFVFNNDKFVQYYQVRKHGRQHPTEKKQTMLIVLGFVMNNSYIRKENEQIASATNSLNPILLSIKNTTDTITTEWRAPAAKNRRAPASKWSSKPALTARKVTNTINITNIGTITKAKSGSNMPQMKNSSRSRTKLRIPR